MWEKDIISQGGHTIYLWTYDFNVSFYTKRGFVTGGEFKKAWASENVFLMYKVLQKPNEENYLRAHLEKKKMA